MIEVCVQSVRWPQRRQESSRLRQSGRSGLGSRMPSLGHKSGGADPVSAWSADRTEAKQMERHAG
jgi:hypothetical protein